MARGSRRGGKEDQILGAVMTDKATVEIPSPRAGVVVELGGELGSRLAVGSLLVGIRFGADDDGVANGCEDVVRIADFAGSEGIPVDLEVTFPTAADRAMIFVRAMTMLLSASSGAKSAPSAAGCVAGD